jgi:hypothetical protein
VIAARSRPRAAPVLGTGAALAAAALWFFDPNTHRVPLCPLHELTGLWCPLCGCTRASHALLHGQFATAVHDNALFVASLPLIALLWWRWFNTPDAGRDGRLLPRPVFWAGVIMMLAFGVLRNLPSGRWLAPPS